jgi:hypothetical protein
MSVTLVAAMGVIWFVVLLTRKVGGWTLPVTAQPAVLS